MRARDLIVLAWAVASAACGRSGDTDPDVVPNPPLNFTANGMGSGRAQAIWTDASDNEASFVIEVSQDGVNWADALIVDQGVTSALVPGLLPGVVNHLQVRSINVKGRSAPAGPVQVTPAVPAWDGPDPGPADLYWAASAYDSRRRRMLVFGGRNNTPANTNSLYAINLSLDPPAWFPMTVQNTPPTPRSGASMIYDPDGDRLILFGGQVGSSVTTEIWEYKFVTGFWSPLLTLGPTPSARQHHKAIYDPIGKRMVICGGEAGGVLQFDTPVLNLSSKTLPTWSGLTPIPAARTRHSAVYDGVGRRVLVFGGGDFQDAFQDVLSLNLDTNDWTTLAPQGTPPDPRLGHVAVWDELNHQMLVYGGADAFEFPIDGLWALALSGTPTWRPLAPSGTPPNPLFYAAGVYDDVTGKFLLFGGAVDDTLFGTNEIWTLGL